MEPIETYEHQGVTVEIHYDQDASDFCNPRQNDGNIATMVCWHPDYVLGDEQLKDGNGRGAVDNIFETERGRTDVPSMRHLHRYLSLMRGGICVLPLYLYDHSGISISAGTVNPFDNPTVRRDEFGRGMGWDTSMVGFVYTTAETIAEHCGADKADDEAFVRKQVLAEVKEYDSYLRGEVYGYVVDPDGPDQDACWGFVGDDEYVKEAANEAAEYVAQERAERRRKRGRGLHRGAFVTAGGTT